MPRRIRLAVANIRDQSQRRRKKVLQNLVGVDSVLISAGAKWPLNLVIVLSRPDLNDVANAR